MKLTPTIVYSMPNPKELLVEHQTAVKTISTTYNFPGITNHVDYDGDNVETEIFFRDRKLEFLCGGKSSGTLKTTRELVDDKTLKITTIVVDKNVSCYRLFRRSSE